MSGILLLCVILREIYRVYCWQMIIADAVEDESISRDGNESRKPVETAAAPWVGYNEEETMKAQILALSKVIVM